MYVCMYVCMQLYVCNWMYVHACRQQYMFVCVLAFTRRMCAGVVGFRLR